MLSRPCRVRAVIERPPAPPWIAADRLPIPGREPWWPGRIRAWRWIDRDKGTWTALVDYSRDGLLYSHWVHGDLLDVEPGPSGDSPTAGA